MRHVSGLNSLRFLCAFWVVLSHLRLPDFLCSSGNASVIARVWNGVLNNTFPGVCAVIAFFVISGFCIHVAHVESLRIGSLPSYFARRYIRLAVPLVVALAFDYFLTVDLNGLILWSLYCELIYYTVYPVFLILRRRGIPWSRLIAAAFGASAVVAICNRHAGDFHAPGIGLTWLLGLPCWLLGCLLAERSAIDHKDPISNIWLARAGLCGGAILCSVLRFHSSVGYGITLPAFGFVIYGWILQEIRHFRSHEPFKLFEDAGRWSYSLYLVHLLAYALCLKLGAFAVLGGFSWFARIGFVLLTSYAFATIVEFPAHRLARYGARRLR